MSWLGRLVVLLALGSAATSACRPHPGPARGSGDGRHLETVEGTPSGQRWLSSDAERARAAGAGEPQVLTVEAGVPGDRISSFVIVPENACALLVARATESVEDIDLYAYGEDGSVLGSDEAPNRRPTLMVCPPHPKRVFVVARIAGGHGLVALGAQEVAVGAAERVGRAMAAHGHPGEASGRAEAWPGLTERISVHREQIGGRWQDVRKVALPIEPRLPTRVSALVEAERCLDVLVVPSEEVAHLDVSVLDQTGRIVGRALAAGRDRSIVLCSPLRQAITIEVRPHSGRGLAALVLSRSVPGSEPEIRAETRPLDVAPTAELDEVRQEHAERLRRWGYDAPKPLGQATAQVGKRTSLAVELPPGCARIDVLSGRPVRSLEAWLWLEDGTLVAHDRRGGPLPLFACGPGSKARLDVEALTQPGRFAAELRKEGPTPPALSEQPLAAGRLLARMVDRGVIQNAEQIGAAQSVSVGPARLHRQDLLVPLNRCVDVTFALGAGTSGAELRIVERTTGEELAAARGTFSASARVCSLEGIGSQQARIEVRSLAGVGPALLATRMLAPKP